MRRTILVLALAALMVAMVAPAAVPTLAENKSPSTQHASTGAVFVQTDNPNANAIVAYHRSSDGTLHPAGTYPTGGLGGVLGGSVVDHLASQGSLAYDHANGLLYAVNAGSNTITVFAVHGDSLKRLQVISSGGTFPGSVDFHGNRVYVLNARDGGSIQGYKLASGRLVNVPAWHRNLGLDPALTPEFTHTPGQIGFTPDGSKIVVTTKANGDSIDVFTLGPGGLPADPVGTNAVATFTINGDGTLTSIAQIATGGAATCWISGTGTLFYTSNSGSDSLSGFRDTGQETLTALGDTSTDPGPVDSAIASGKFLYVQIGANGIVDEYRINSDGSLSAIGSVTVPGSVGGEGIAAT